MRQEAYSDPDRLVKLLKGYNLGRSKIAVIIRKLRVLLKTKGQAGTLQYLKACSARFKHWYSRGDIPIPEGGPWVNFRMWKRLVKKRGQLVKMFMALHRVITFTNLTPQQWEKFSSAALREDPDKGPLVDALAYVRVGARRIQGRIGPCPGTPVYRSYVERALSKVSGDRYEGLYRARSDLLIDLYWAADNGYLDYAAVQSSYAPISPNHLREFADGSNRDESLWISDEIGVLLNIQEPGGKCRFAASPRLAVQNWLGGLFERLDDILYMVEEDAAHDQWAGVCLAQDKLREGHTLWSTDISEATNSVPLELQTCLLRELGADEETIDLYRKVSRSEWSTSKDVQELTGVHSISWTVGQPLGVKPSFALFSLTMHALLKGICKVKGFHGVFPHTDPYLQLGDDHIGWQPEVEEEFIRILRALGVQISSEKSLVSSYCAEFGGAYIRKDGFTFRPGKWRSVTEATAIAYAADENFNPYHVWPKPVSDLVMKLRQRPWPYGFHKTDPEDLSAEDRAQALSLLTNGLYRCPDFTIHDADWDLISVTFGDWFENQGGDTHNFSHHRNTEFNQYSSEWRRIEFACQQSGDSFWRQSNIGHFTCSFQEEFPSRPTWLAQHVPVYTRMVATVFTIPFEEAILHPFVRRVALRRRCTTNAQLVGALIEASPFRRYENYRRSSNRAFLSLLKRVAEQKDVIPRRLCPAPVIR